MGFNLENYETVEDRLIRFWADHPGGRIHTSIHHYDDNKVVVRAEVYFDRHEDVYPIGTGYAEEVRGASPVNKTSHVENAETSAVGRALANCNYAPKGARPSREEMSKVQRGQSVEQATKVATEKLGAKVVGTDKASPATVAKLITVTRERKLDTKKVFQTATDTFGREIKTLKDLTQAEADSFIATLETM